jgi:predicted DNA-binding protein (UPF0278 family)
MKNFIKRLKNLTTLLLFALFIGIPFSACAAVASKPPAIGGPMELSPEDLKMLEEIGKEVESYVNALPTEAQLRAQGVSEDDIKKRETREKFDAEVKRYSEMSEKQLLEEMEKVFAEAASQMPPPPAPEVAPPAPPTPEIAKPIEKPIVPSDKQLAALKLIDTVLININNFMNKAQIMVELSAKIPNWVKEGKLRNWPANLTWNTFNAQVEELQVKLNKIKDRDPRTGSYKYLDDFIKDESLNNNLAKVRDSLMRNEPKIELSSFGIDKMTSESRAAVRSVLLSLHEATSILAIPSALDKIIEKYEPTAKKIKESEESAQKRAFEESRRTRYPGPSVTSTMPPRERPEIYGRGREFDRFTMPTYEAPTRPGERPSEAFKPGEKGGGAGAAGAEKKPEAVKAEEKPKREPDKKADQYESEFLTGLESFTDAVHENAHFTDIEKHVKSADSIDDEVTELIKIATDGVKKAANAVRKMKLQLSKLNENQKKEYKKALKDGYKNAKKDIDSLSSQLNNISKASNVIGALPLGANPAHRENVKSKYFAYFGKEGQSAIEAQYEAKKKNLEDLKEDLEVKRAQITDAKQKAAAAGAPVPGNIAALENETVKIRGQIRTLETEIKKLEGMLSQAGKANLHDLQAKIKDLKKAVDEI